MKEPARRHVSRTSLGDVAKVAGVSTPTASKILNKVPGLSVKQETRDRVLRAASELGYEPHAIARALAGARAGSIALLIPDLTNPIYAQMIRGAFERARELGYTVLIAEDSEGQVADDRFERLVQAGHVDGLLIATARQGHPLLTDLKDKGVPHVFVNRVPGTERGVSMQVRQAGALAAQVLADAGHAYLGHVSGPLDVDTSRARAEGFVAAATRLGLPEPVVVNHPFDERGGSDGLLELLGQEPRITAVFSTSINQVIGVLHRAHGTGLRVPQDLSVLAYDDLPLAEFLIPPVTTIVMPLHQLGREAVEALLDQVEGGSPANRMVAIPPRVVHRQSVARPATDR
jgi:LacI family transcriptional regulator